MKKKYLFVAALSSLLLSALPTNNANVITQDLVQDKPAEKIYDAFVNNYDDVNGYLVPSDNKGMSGQKMTLTALPNKGHKVLSVTANGQTLTSKDGVHYEFTLIKGDNKIKAEFSQYVSYCRLIVKQNTDYFKVSGMYYFEIGKKYSLVIEHNEKSKTPRQMISEVTLNGKKPTEGKGEYNIIFTATEGTSILEIKTEPFFPILTLNVQSNEFGKAELLPTQDKYIKKGEKVKIRVTPNPGYELSYVKIGRFDIPVQRGAREFEFVPSDYYEKLKHTGDEDTISFTVAVHFEPIIYGAHIKIGNTGQADIKFLTTKDPVLNEPFRFCVYAKRGYFIQEIKFNDENVFKQDTSRPGKPSRPLDPYTFYSTYTPTKAIDINVNITTSDHTRAGVIDYYGDYDYILHERACSSVVGQELQLSVPIDGELIFNGETLVADEYGMCRVTPLGNDKLIVKQPNVHDAYKTKEEVFKDATLMNQETLNEVRSLINNMQDHNEIMTHHEINSAHYEYSDEFVKLNSGIINSASIVSRTIGQGSEILGQLQTGINIKENQSDLFYHFDKDWSQESKFSDAMKKLGLDFNTEILDLYYHYTNSSEFTNTELLNNFNSLNLKSATKIIFERLEEYLNSHSGKVYIENDYKNNKPNKPIKPDKDPGKYPDKPDKPNSRQGYTFLIPFDDTSFTRLSVDISDMDASFSYSFANDTFVFDDSPINMSYRYEIHPTSTEQMGGPVPEVDPNLGDNAWHDVSLLKGAKGNNI